MSKFKKAYTVYEEIVRHDFDFAHDPNKIFIHRVHLGVE